MVWVIEPSRVKTLHLLLPPEQQGLIAELTKELVLPFLVLEDLPP